MLITRRSLMTGIVRVLDLDVTPEQIERWQAGTVAQVAFAHLPADQREYLMTGIVQSEWDTLKTEED